MRHTAHLATFLVLLAAPAMADSFVTSDPPSARDALRLVFHNAGLPLPDNPSCDGVVTGLTQPPTLGDWLSSILAALPPQEGTSGILAGCDGPAEALQCHVEVTRSSGEEVWTWGVRFTAESTDGRIEPASIRCDAAG